MSTTITCEKCGAEIEISKALQHQVEEQILAAERLKHQKEIEAMKERVQKEAVLKSQKGFESQIDSLQKEKEEEKERNRSLLKQLEEVNEGMRTLQRKDEERDLEMQKRLRQEEERIREDARKKFQEERGLKDREREQKLREYEKQVEDLKRMQKETALKSQKDFESQIDSLQKEREEEKERNTSLLKQLEEVNETIRTLRRKDEERNLEMQKKLADEEGRIREDARKRFQEEHDLKDREREQKLKDYEKQVEEMKRKIQQGSQQQQGEVMELALEELLCSNFPEDTITEVKKGQHGADVSQSVISRGRQCGMVLWESKNAQWNKAWLAKLRQDQRNAKADIAVLVVTHPPQGVDTFAFVDGVWVTKRQYVAGLATALRNNLISLYTERANNAVEDDKKEALYEYLTGVEFRHRVEGIAEAFTNLQEDIERERRWFTTKWARQEKEIRRIVDNTQGMYGDLQSATGRELPPISDLELPPGSDE